MDERSHRGNLRETVGPMQIINLHKENELLHRDTERHPVLHNWSTDERLRERLGSTSCREDVVKDGDFKNIVGQLAGRNVAFALEKLVSTIFLHDFNSDKVTF